MAMTIKQTSTESLNKSNTAGKYYFKKMIIKGFITDGYAKIQPMSEVEKDQLILTGSAPKMYSVHQVHQQPGKGETRMLSSCIKK